MMVKYYQMFGCKVSDSFYFALHGQKKNTTVNFKGKTPLTFSSGSVHKAPRVHVKWSPSTGIQPSTMINAAMALY